MNLPQTDSHDLYLLLEKLIDNNLDTQETILLNEILEADPQARKTYVEFIKMHVNIQWHVIEPAGMPLELPDELLSEESLNSFPQSSSVTVSFNNATEIKSSQPQLGFLSHCMKQTASFLTRPASLSIMLAFLTIGCGLLTLALLRLDKDVPDKNQSVANGYNDEEQANRKVAYVLKATADATVAKNSLPIKQFTELGAGTVRLTRGRVRIQFNQGAVVTLRAPAVFEIQNKQQGALLAGSLQATVPPLAIGFIVDTPFVQVEDLGTKFSVWVEKEQWTYVSVEQGKVNARSISGESKGDPLLLRQGQAARFTSSGNRPELITQESDPALQRYSPYQPVISKVSANTDHQYKVIHHGFDEDVKAYTDRSHEWNGVDLKGLPLELINADYVMTSRADEADPNLQIKVTVAKRTMLYVFFDSRLPVPEWLSKGFVKTALIIGLDRDTNKDSNGTGIGPGRSIDNKLHVWQKIVSSGEFTLGYNAIKQGGVDAYGIAAVAIEQGDETSKTKGTE